MPNAAAKARAALSDGTYTFTVDPTRDQGLVLGANLLYLPANAICDIASSSYGPSHWDETCALQTAPLTITAVVKNASSAHPSIDFSPAMRFSPDREVAIFFYLQGALKKESPRNWSVNYCNDAGVCLDESINDPSLRTYLDWNGRIAFRRIKHFSGYIVAFEADASASALY